jgi:predicted metalloprotease
MIDRRGERMSAGGGGLIQLAFLLLRFKYGWILLLLLVGISYFSGAFRSGTTVDASRAAGDRGTPAAHQPGSQADFVGFVLDDAQRTWDGLLQSGPVPYRHAKLVLFTDATRTACGFGEAATGPFYCPRDERVYIDLGFYNELSRRFGANGDFAQAYVIAHEIGHHVQKILGISERVQNSSSSALKGATGLSVRLELQADCLAGMWAHSTAKREILEKGDIEEGLGAAAAIGDDRIQRQSTGRVHPESWTHGSSAERTRWFRKGYEEGSMKACDTFSTGTL